MIFDSYPPWNLKRLNMALKLWLSAGAFVALTTHLVWFVGTRAFIFHMSIPCEKTFPWVSTFLTLTLMFDHLIENFNLVYIFWFVGIYEIWHFTCVFLVTRPYSGYQKFDLVTFTLVCDLLIKNFNLGYNFWMASTRALIFHMGIPSDKTFQWVPTDLTM
jgi:hypothetical protein